MKAQECRDQIQTTLNKICPDLKMYVMSHRSQMNIQCCMGRLSYRFYIDITEWERSKWPEHIVEIRLHDTLVELRNVINKTLKELE